MKAMFVSIHKFYITTKQIIHFTLKNLKEKKNMATK
jgi:hypothetical protein